MANDGRDLSTIIPTSQLLLIPVVLICSTLNAMSLIPKARMYPHHFAIGALNLNGKHQFNFPRPDPRPSFLPVIFIKLGKSVSAKLGDFFRSFDEERAPFSSASEWLHLRSPEDGCEESVHSGLLYYKAR